MGALGILETKGAHYGVADEGKARLSSCFCCLISVPHNELAVRGTNSTKQISAADFGISAGEVH